MVKTRHTPEVAEESPATFLSIEKRRSRLPRNNVDLNQDEGSDDSGIIQFKSGRSGRRRHVDDTPLQRRALRTSAKRVSYVEDFIDEDFTQARRRGRPAVLVTDDDTDDDNLPAQEERSQPSRMTRTRRRDINAPVEDSESSSRPVRSTRRSQNNIDQEAKDIKEEELQDLEQNGIRRSSRNRRLLYSSFDQKVIEQSGYVEDEEPKRKRARTDAEQENSNGEDDDDQFKDMYSRVKRKRKCVKRDMYGMPIEESDDEGNEEEEDSDDESEDDSSDEEQEDDNGEGNEEGEKSKKKSKDVAPRSYYLRENKPRTQLYNAPLQEKRPRAMSRMFNVEMSHHSPARRRSRPVIGNYMSPARRNFRGSRRRAAFHGSSSTSSSSSDSSDEERFQRRKAKSMMKSRQRCLPMNFDQELINNSNILRDRQKVGSSLADVDPMNIDRSITFDSVGGLGKHIRALKEMVVFPLLYPEIFERFKIAPPRGVLFYGPPGTGKTLVARALANECSVDDRRVAFYMRKGADCLSKWVGESERQLRLLFDQAYQTRPSIIFFDEIDGLAPVRSSRQDQIHSSIVSTLLALMDGLDSRGEIVVIGATNRIDSIDPALRRPGRFDREFLFPLPSIQARGQILKINTKDWNPKLCDKFVTEVAEHCTGYCGADMKALCTEAALLALRRRYPQIYTSSEKLQIDVTSINVNARDFYLAMQNIVPTSQRSMASPARSLNSTIAPLLNALYQEVLTKLNEIFPSVLSQLANLDTDDSKEKGSEDEGVVEDTESSMAIYEQRVDKRRKNNMPELPEKFLNFTSYANQHPSTHRPRLMLSGGCDQGQTSHLAPAVLHHMEQLPVHVLDLSTLFAVSARTPEEGCAQIFREARRTSPSIVYLPHINQWWGVLPDTVRMTILTLIQDVNPSCPLLILATSEDTYTELDFSIQDLFDEFSGEVIHMRNPSSEERKLYFQELLLTQATQPPAQRKVAAQRLLEVLPKAPPPEPRKFTDQELAKIHEHEEATLRELRLFLRDVLNKLGRDRKFFIFTKPVDIEDVPDYYEIIKSPMDLSTMMSKIDLHRYTSVKEFMEDIEQICMNALEYNPDKDPQSRVIRHRACALRDTTYAIMKAELDPEFEQVCLNIVESRKKRGEDGSKTVPAFYHTRPLKSGSLASFSDTKPAEDVTNTPPSPSRTSTRLRRSNVEEGPSLEEVERTARILRREQRQHSSPEKKKEISSSQEETLFITPDCSKISGSQKSQGSVSDSKGAGSISDSKGSNSDRNTSSKKKAKRSIWGRSGYVRRRRTSVKRNRSMLSEGGGDDEDEDNSEGDMSEDDMEVDETRDYISEQSQSHSSSQDMRRESVTKCLNVDVNMRPHSDIQRSPSHRSPREDTQRSPAASEPISQVHISPGASDTMHRLSSRPENGSKSPRFRHSSGQHSPRTIDCSITHHTDAHQKSPRTSLSSKHPDKVAKHSVSKSLHDITDSSSVQSSQESITQDKNSSSLLKPKGIVVNGFVDSGVGSSDSNGDSNDSASKVTLSSSQETEVSSKEALPETTNTENNEPGCSSDPKSAASPQFRVTRSRIQTKTQEKALEILQGPVEPLVVDRERLARLLDMVVLLTEGYNIGKLEKLYSVLGQCVYQHRLEYNKMAMIEMMERRLRQYTSSVTERLKIEKARSNSMVIS